MSTIEPNALESTQIYPDRFGRKDDVYTRFHCTCCGCLLPEGATEENEMCEPCKGEVKSE